MTIIKGTENEFHDDEIIGIDYDQKTEVLKLSIRKSLDDKLEVLVVEKVVDLDLGPFRYQNVIFGIKEYEADELSESIIKEFEIDDFYIRNKKHGFLIIDSSIGMSGYIIFRL